MATKTSVEIKAEVFDILRSQQTLQLEVQALEQQKNALLKELEDAEKAEAKAEKPATAPKLAE